MEGVLPGCLREMQRAFRAWGAAQAEAPCSPSVPLPKAIRRPWLSAPSPAPSNHASKTLPFHHVLPCGSPQTLLVSFTPNHDSSACFTQTLSSHPPWSVGAPPHQAPDLDRLRPRFIHLLNHEKEKDSNL